MVTASYLGRGLSRSSENGMKPSQEIHVDQVEINKHSSTIQARIHMVRIGRMRRNIHGKKNALGDREAEARQCSTAEGNRLCRS